MTVEPQTTSARASSGPGESDHRGTRSAEVGRLFLGERGILGSMSAEDQEKPGGTGAVRPSLAEDESGVAYVEYIVLALLIGIPVAAAILAVGTLLLEHFRMTQSFLGAPIP